MVTVMCGNCGEVRPNDLASRAERPPCPRCGAANVNITVSVHEAAMTAVAESVTAVLTPGNQDRDWRRKWQDLQANLARLEQRHPAPLSGDGILAAVHELLQFYISAYHLKDSLKADAASTGIAGSDVEDAITANPSLALVADLANVVKHEALSRAPRSGDVPKIGNATGSTVPEGWVVSLTIEHKAQRLDGLQIARDVCRAWRDTLQHWGIL